MTIKSLLILILFTVFCHEIFAQATGKIAGLVSDADNGAPLIGVNISIEGVQLGAASDEDGLYTILNVPPGTHKVVFEYIGYRTEIVEQVVVKIDRTTVVDANLKLQMLELEEAVVVTAERPIVETDKTFSSVHLDAQDVQPLPVEGVRNVLEMSAGILRNPDGTLSIRGGGAYEINYQVNGIGSITTNSGVPAYGTGVKSETSWKYDINPLAISQMEVISGGFNAEYGNAQSGVVKVVTKEGGDKFNGAFVFEYRPPGQYHWGDYLYSKNQFEWVKWGNFNNWLAQPQFMDSAGVVDTASARRNYQLWMKNHSPSDENIFGVYDYRKYAYTRYLFSFGGPLGGDAQTLNFFLSGELKNKPTRLPTREKIQELTNVSLVLSWKPRPEDSFKLTGMYQKYLSGMGSGSDDIRWAGLWGRDGAKRKYTLIYDSPREETVFAQSLTYKHVFSSKSFLEATLTRQQEVLYALQTPTPSTETDIQAHPYDLENREIEDKGPWFEEYRQYFTWSSLYNQASVTNFYEGKVSVSNQLTHTNLLKAGAQAWMMDQDYNASSSLAVSAFIWRTGFATNYKAKTWYAAGYVQDKLEFAGMVGNFGFRVDAFNYGIDVPANRYELFYPAEGAVSPGVPEWEKSKTRVTVSPRAGLSFPIGETTAFRVQYGHFRSMPPMNRALDNQTNYGWGSYGNPNLKSQLSINYEVGIQQNLWGTHQLDVVTYYNDLKDQVSVVFVRASSGTQNPNSRPDGLESTYISYDNHGYGNARGIEITLANKDESRWRYRLSYALSQTTYGNYGLQVDREDLTGILEQRYQYPASDLLAPEDRTHRFNASLTYSLAKDQGPAFGSIRPFEDLTMSLIYRVQSGNAYFWSPTYQTTFEVESNRRYPLEAQTDLRIEKGFDWNEMRFKAAIRILNLFNNKHLTPFYTSAETEAWVLRNTTYMDGAYPYNYFQAYKNIPRQVFLSLGVSF